MTIHCEDIHETLSAYVDGEETHGETIAARAHLEACDSCRVAIDEWQQIERALTLEMNGPVVTEAEAARAPVPAPVRRGFARAGLAAAVVAMAIAGVVLADVGGGEVPIDPAGSAGAVPLVTRSDEGSRPAEKNTKPPTTRPDPRPTVKPSDPPPPPREEPVVTRGSNGSLAVVLTIERRYAVAGETLSASFTLRNVTKEPITFSAPADSPVDLVIRDPDGNEVWRRSAAEGWARAMTDRTLQPGEQLAERFTFVAPDEGAYLIAGQCVCMPAGFDPNDPKPAGKSSGSSKPFETQPIKFASARARS